MAKAKARVLTVAAVPKKLRALFKAKKLIAALRDGVRSYSVAFDLEKKKRHVKIFGAALKKLKRQWKGVVSVIVRTDRGHPTGLYFAQ